MWLDGLAIRRADAVGVISEHLRNELRERGLRSHVYIVPNGVDVSEFGLTKRKQKLVEALSLKGKTVLGYVGTFSADYKGLEHIIEALPLIKEKCPEAVLLLVWDGKLRPHLETIAKRMGVRENVIFAGRIAHDSVRDYYSIMDICVYPRKLNLLLLLNHSKHGQW